MSSVRMCDRCGEIFSENDEGWSTTTGSVQRRRENGTRFGEQVTIDLCVTCTGGGPKVTVPRLPGMLTGGKVVASTVTGSAETAAEAAEREDDHVMLRNLERELAELRERDRQRAEAGVSSASTNVDATSSGRF